MKKALALILLLGLYCFSSQGTLSLYAQEADEEEEPPYNEGIPLEPDWEGYIPDLYSRGDKIFTISLGVIFPAKFYFYNDREAGDSNFSPPVGGTGSLSYTYFLNSHLFLGGELAFKFNGTAAKNTIFFIPIGVRGGWQFVLGRFEFPLFAVIGVSILRYVSLDYVGVFTKLGGGAYFRFSPNWSFGINADWSWYPQRPYENGKRAPEKDVDGHVIGLTLSARYHF